MTWPSDPTLYVGVVTMTTPAVRYLEIESHLALRPASAIENRVSAIQVFLSTRSMLKSVGDLSSVHYSVDVFALESVR